MSPAHGGDLAAFVFSNQTAPHTRPRPAAGHGGCDHAHDHLHFYRYLYFYRYMASQVYKNVHQRAVGRVWVGGVFHGTEEKLSHLF